MASDFFEMAKPTYLENWPDALHRASIASQGFPLTPGQAAWIGVRIRELGEMFNEYRTLADQANESMNFTWQRVSEAIASLRNGAFIRLGSRSPKDSWHGLQNGFKVKNSHEAQVLLCDVSERIADDLLLALENDYQPYLWVREWVDLEPWQELRCFVRGRKLIGISQYNYLDKGVVPVLRDYHGGLQWAVEQFFDALKPHLHLDDVVMDVFFKHRSPGGTTHEWQVKLLEINPWCMQTDPCLHRWQVLNCKDTIWAGFAFFDGDKVEYK